MTLWRWNENGPNQNHYTPKKHVAEQALWRSFGIIAMDSSTSEEQKYHRPGIFSQYQRLKNAVGSRWTDLVGVSMVDDGNATSWLPVDEIFDSFQINDVVITDSDPDGWIIRINDAVETTKEVVSGIFRSYLKGICEIRNLKTTNPVDPIARGFIDDETAKVYAEIDFIFKDWLASLTPKDSKEDKIKLWNAQLRKIILKHGEELFENSTERDLTGIETDTGIENIATKYWQFIYRINKKLGKGVTN
jgi:CRISPR system Cascade subunit CasA